MNISQVMDLQHVPGLALGIQRGEDRVFEQYHGFANLEHRVPVSAGTVFEIASVTKLFTAQAVLRLVQDGRVALDTSIAAYLPGLPDAWKVVTIRHCLSHQSGIPNYTSVPHYWELTRVKKPHEDVLGLVRDQPLAFAPGERHAYDNTGFYLLGMVIEAVTGRAYGEYLREIIFEPLGMTQTQANDYDRIVPGRAQGYVYREGTFRNKAFYDTSNTFGAGVLLSSVRDLLRWCASLKSDAVLDAPTRQLWWTPHPSLAANERAYPYTLTLGWFIVDHPMGQFYGHNGGIEGFASSLVYLPGTDTAAVALYNVDRIDEPHQVPLQLLREHLLL